VTRRLPWTLCRPSRLGLPPRSFAADAHDCIMVAIRFGSTEYKVVTRCSRPDRELPLDRLQTSKTASNISAFQRPDVVLVNQGHHMV
jgi:hypothetical protein